MRLQDMPNRRALALAAVLGASSIAPQTAGAQVLATDRIEAHMMIAGARDDSGLPMGEERLTVKIDGQHASSSLVQVYENKTEGQIEGRYRLKPGSGAHVDGFAYWNGEQKIVGEVFERQEAKRVYENVVARKRDPGLLEEDGEGAFAFKIFPIAAHEKKRVEVDWSKWLERRDHAVKYRAPVSRRDADIVIELAGSVKNLRSPTHKLQIDKTATGLRIRSAGAVVGGELELDWDVDEPDWTPDAYVHAVPGDDGWFALSLAAPQAAQSAVTAKDMTIVIDRSGSMAADDKIEHAKAAAINMIEKLSPRDRVNVIAFSDEVDNLFNSPMPVDAATRARAIAFVERLHDGGGTDLALALKTAIDEQAAKVEGPRVVVFLTDGESDAQNALDTAKLDTRDIRLFTLGLGSDVNKPLLQRLAATKRGTFGFIDSAASIESEVGKLASHISRPLLVDVSVEVQGPVASRIYPRTFPDLYAQDELVVTGRLRGAGMAKLTIRGKLDGKPVAYTRTVDFSRAPSRPWVGALWAQARVGHLLEDISLTGAKPELVDEATNLALTYNFVTPYTAFLAVPESELGGMASTVEAMRDKKKKLLAENPDVEALKNNKSAAPMGSVATNQPAPARARTFTAQKDAIDVDEDSVNGESVNGDMDGEDDEDSGKEMRKAKRTADASGADYDAEPIAASGRTHAHGCAGCATGGGESSLALVLFVGALLSRRRRR